MSRRSRNDNGEDQGDEPVEGTVSPSAELEDALREATEALGGDAVEEERSPTGKSVAASSGGLISGVSGRRLGVPGGWLAGRPLLL